MSYQMDVENKDRYLHVRISGDNTPENVLAYLRDIYDACASAGVPNVFIEENLQGPALDPADVYRVILESSARTAPVIKRIAYVDLNPQHPQSNIKLGEVVARDQGVNVMAFSTVLEAIEWLETELGLP
jgi:hypothetical protein